MPLVTQYSRMTVEMTATIAMAPFWEPFAMFAVGLQLYSGFDRSAYLK